MDKSEERKQKIINAAQEGAAAEVVQRYGEAVMQHDVAYNGVNNETGLRLTRGLKKTAQSKVNPKFEKTNIKQQSGYIAEDEKVAKDNSERIINKQKTRSSRTDDVNNGTYKVNDPLVDIVELDSNGKIIRGSELQMKFVGNNSKECLSKLMSKKYEKYIDNDVAFSIPHDYYQGVIEETVKQINKVERQIERCRESNPEVLEKLQRKLAKLKKIHATVKDSGITTKEAIFARKYPRLATAKEIVKISHKAGVEQAKTGAAIGMGISLIKNVTAVVKNEKNIKEASVDLAKDTAVGAISGYSVAFTGSTIKGLMQNSSKGTLRALSKTNLPATVVMTTYDIGRTTYSLFKGEITCEQFLGEIGENGAAQLSSALFATIGQTVIPVPVVGAMAGSMIGYIMSKYFYGELVNSIRDARIARENRIEIETYCREVEDMIDEYISEMQQLQEQYFAKYEEIFDDAFTRMDIAIEEGNYDMLIKGANLISTSLGKECYFKTVDDFTEKIMNTNNTLKF